MIKEIKETCSLCKGDSKIYQWEGGGVKTYACQQCHGDGFVLTETEEPEKATKIVKKTKK